MSAALDPAADATPGSLLSASEKFQLGSRLALALMSASLLLLSVTLRQFFPQETGTARLIATAAAALIAGPVLLEAWRALRSPSLHGVTDLLVAAALIGAWAMDDLETAALVPLAMVIGHVLEERSLLGSRDAIAALARLDRQRARRRRADGSCEDVTVEALRVGDELEVRPGDRLAADVRVVEGRSAIDAAALTGESLPQEVAPGDEVPAGAINRHGMMLVSVLRVGSETALGRVVTLLAEAEQAKPPVTRLLERFAMPYLVLVLCAACAAMMLGGSLGAGLGLLVAACPCALVLAAPATAVAAIAVAAQHGLLVKGTAFLEHLAEVDSLVIDKTGTLTLGRLTRGSVLPCAEQSEDELLRMAVALAANSNHPVSQAIVQSVSASIAATAPRLTLVTESPGAGLSSELDGKCLMLGRVGFLREHGVTVEQVPDHDGPLVGVAHGGELSGWLTFTDETRADARAALEDLRREGVTQQILLTGDRARTAQAIATGLGLSEVRAEATPADKLSVVRALTAAGRRPLVVGDGLNDVLALKAGAVGVAMGSGGIDAALASADVVLTSDRLTSLAVGLRLSRRCRTIVGQNIAIGLGWTGVVVAAVTLGGLGPVAAVLLHHVGTLAVVANSGRLLGYRDRT